MDCLGNERETDPYSATGRPSWPREHSKKHGFLSKAKITDSVQSNQMFSGFTTVSNCGSMSYDFQLTRVTEGV